MRLSYEESCVQLGHDPSDIPPLKDRPPRSDDEVLGLSFYKSGIEQEEWRSLTVPRTFIGRSLIEDTSIVDCDLSESVLCWNDFISVDFSESDFSQADMRYSIFLSVNFSNCILRHADFRGSGIEECDFSGADLAGAILETPEHGRLPLTPEQKNSIQWVDAELERAPETSTHLGFQYDIEYHPLRNEKGEKRRLEDRLQTEFIGSNNMRRLQTGVRGRLHTSGFIWHDTRSLTDADRDNFAEWARTQPIDGTVRLGAIENLDAADFNRRLTEIEFRVNQPPKIPLTSMGPMLPEGESDSGRF